MAAPRVDLPGNEEFRYAAESLNATLQYLQKKVSALKDGPATDKLVADIGVHLNTIPATPENSALAAVLSWMQSAIGRGKFVKTMFEHNVPGVLLLLDSHTIEQAIGGTGVIRIHGGRIGEYSASVGKSVPPPAETPAPRRARGGRGRTRGGRGRGGKTAPEQADGFTVVTRRGNGGVAAAKALDSGPACGPARTAPEKPATVPVLDPSEITALVSLMGRAGNSSPSYADALRRPRPPKPTEAPKPAVAESLTDTTTILEAPGVITDWAEEEPASSAPQIVPEPAQECTKDRPECIQIELPADCLPDLPSKKKKKASTPRA